MYASVNHTTIGSDNGLSPGRHQAIIWTSAGILLIGPLGTNFSEILIEIYTFSFKKIHLKMLYGKWWPFCLGLNVLMYTAFQKGWTLHPCPIRRCPLWSNNADNDLWICTLKDAWTNQSSTKPKSVPKLLDTTLLLYQTANSTLKIWRNDKKMD